MQTLGKPGWNRFRFPDEVQAILRDAADAIALRLRDSGWLEQAAAAQTIADLQALPQGTAMRQRARNHLEEIAWMGIREHLARTSPASLLTFFRDMPAINWATVIAFKKYAAARKNEPIVVVQI